MNITLVEFKLAGHRILYLEMYSQILTDLGHSVTILCPTPEKLPFLYLIPGLGMISMPTFPKKKYRLNKFNDSLNKIREWKKISKLLSSYHKKTDLLFFMFFDPMFFDFNNVRYFRIPFYKIFNPLIPFILDQIVSYSWTGILFLPTKHSSNSLKYIYRSKKNHLVLTLDETLKDGDLYLKRHKHIPLPDPTNLNLSEIPNIPLIDKILENAKGRKIVSILGTLEKRKGILTLLDAAQILFDRDVFFVFAGNILAHTFTEIELNRLMAAQDKLDNCYFYFQRIDKEEEYNNIFAISSIIYMNYLNHYHSSNTLTKSSYFKIPVIASNEGCIGQRVNKYKLGIIVRPHFLSDTVEAIERLLKDGFEFDEEKRIEYYTYHSYSNLKAILKEQIVSL